ncbi:MAG TPA: 4-(cytidine 5'-diphospho)-2-C-methyl-D-erythritol kinase [Spirochaetota bacterium]|nr:4-(cytidine 5'-diphospho)-2-C-methyl-D-erythritol kinase [Spirochaetota bacterium]
MKSYAKINIHLEVLNRRSDNYHNLFSLFAEVDLCDLLKLEDYTLSNNSGEVSVEILNNGGDFSSIVEEIPVEKNLITIAVKKYMASIGRGGHFIFSITKNIPSGAGMGGGSSNAAAALKIVSGVLEREIDDELRNSASSTGSDVPFFLEGGFAFVEGRGELVSRLDFNDESFILLVNNGIHINTGSAYNSLKRAVFDTVINCSDRKRIISEGIARKQDWKNLFKNDFETGIFSSYPQIGFIKENLYDYGAFFASMTGSGSTVFGLFSDEYSAKNVQKILENDGNRVYFTKFRSN